MLEECRAVIAEQAITLFEAATIAAFLAFSRHKADITLIEVGMGGRLDTTNVIDSPILTIITSIALDHTEYLGPTIEIIAGEKAGIMKPNVPCVIAPQEKSIMNTLEYHAINKKSPLYRGGFEWNCEKQDNRMVFQSAIQSIEFSLPSLKGDHQIINAGNAIAACSILSGKYGFDIGEEDITSGLQCTYWPARLERIKEGNLISLLPKDWQLFLDGAHNNENRLVKLMVTINDGKRRNKI
ncbi:folylpolyglutamate synthase [Wolbachia endosymbiont of Drosophila ananassae]|nr:folylpolyglutamate synthase [Wolbachia endosymbiont of Drosophila ananassae]